MLTYITENYFVCLLILTLVLALAGVECFFSAQNREDRLAQTLQPLDHLSTMQEQYCVAVEAEIKKSKRFGYAFVTVAVLVLFVAFFF